MFSRQTIYWIDLSGRRTIAVKGEAMHHEALELRRLTEERDRAYPTFAVGAA